MSSAVRSDVVSRKNEGSGSRLKRHIYRWPRAGNYIVDDSYRVSRVRHYHTAHQNIVGANGCYYGRPLPKSATISKYRVAAKLYGNENSLIGKIITLAPRPVKMNGGPPGRPGGGDD